MDKPITNLLKSHAKVNIKIYHYDDNYNYNKKVLKKNRNQCETEIICSFTISQYFPSLIVIFLEATTANYIKPLRIALHHRNTKKTI